MKNLSLILFVFISQVLFSQVTYDANDPFSKITKQSVELVTGADYVTMSKTLMNEINTYRLQNGLPKLAYDEKMFTYSKLYADSMTSTNTYNHSDLNGGEYKLENINLLKTVGTFLFLDEKMVKSIPTTILNSWESSPGHNANLLSKDVTKVGIAISSVVYMKNGFYVYDIKAVMVAK
jgi:uncharacterized protein YkwD